MAIRKIRTQGDSILTKECRKVDKMTPKIRELIDDMFDTMYQFMPSFRFYLYLCHT